MSSKSFFKVLLICLLLASGATAFANNGQPGGGGRNRQPGRGVRPPALPDSTQIVQIVADLAEALSLTDVQKDKISELHFAHFAEAKAAMTRAKGDQANHRKMMEGLRDEFEKDVKAELNDEQKTKFEELAKSRRARPGPAGQRRR